MSSQRSSIGRSLPEWVTFAAAAAVVLAVLLAIGLEWVETPNARAAVHVSVSGIRPEPGRFSVLATVRNDGENTAEAVQVVAALRRGGRTAAEGQQVIDFLAGGEERRLVFIFPGRPADDDVELRVAGYQVP